MEQPKNPTPTNSTATPSSEAQPDVITPEESAIIAQTLQPATAKRIKILTQQLMSTTASADFWLWGPLAGLEAVFLEMPWDEQRQPLASERLLCLAGVALRRLSERYLAFLADLEDARTRGEPAPKVALWTDADTQDVYDLVSAVYADDDRERNNQRLMSTLGALAVLPGGAHGVSLEAAALEKFVTGLTDAQAKLIDRWAMNVMMRSGKDGDQLPVLERPRCVPAPEFTHTPTEQTETKQ